MSNMKIVLTDAALFFLFNLRTVNESRSTAIHISDRTASVHGVASSSQVRTLFVLLITRRL